MKFVFNDGGRAEAGYKGTARDCVVRAISIATQFPYQKIYDDLFSLNSNQRGKLRGASPRDGGTKSSTVRIYLDSLGWRFVPTMAIGSGCKVHLKEDELPTGTIIVRVSKHLVTVKDGIIYDTYDPSRNGTRCVYGYYIR